MVLEGLHSALVCAPHATLEYMRLGVQQQLATALAVVAGTPRVEYARGCHGCGSRGWGGGLRGWCC